MIITGLWLASFVYLFVSAGFENINAELIEAAQVAGSSRAGVFFKVILPLLRPSLIYGGGVALLLASASSPGRCCSGATGRQRDHDGHVLATTSTPPSTRSLRRSARRCSIFGVVVLFLNGSCSVTQSRFVTHGGKGGFRQGDAGIEAGGVLVVLYRLDRHGAADPRPGRRLADPLLDGRRSTRAPGRSMRTGS